MYAISFKRTLRNEMGDWITSEMEMLVRLYNGKNSGEFSFEVIDDLTL